MNRYDFPLLYDASSKKHHIEYKIEGGSLLTNVSTNTQAVPSLINDAYTFQFLDERFIYFLQHAFRFEYVDLDNGGDEPFNEIKERRIPFYQRKTIPFLSQEIATQGFIDYKHGEREFTFSCWLRYFDVADNVCLWDISGMCVGYIKDDKLHIGHREVVRKEKKEKKGKEKGVPWDLYLLWWMRKA